MAEKDLVQLLTDLKESLEREIRAGFAQVDAKLDQINTRFDTQALRLDRHAALWQTGSRWSVRMDSWAEKVDAALETKDREITELRERLDNGGPQPPTIGPQVHIAPGLLEVMLAPPNATIQRRSAF